MEEVRSKRVKPDFMSNEEWIDYQKGEDEWIYKMQRIALDAEEKQSNLKIEREQKRSDFTNTLKKKALEMKRSEEAKHL